MKKLYKFYCDCGRQGEVESIFAAEESEVNAAIGEEVYFGEILGKHSEIFSTLDEGDFKVLTEDQDFIANFEAIIGYTGYNPLKCLKKDRE